MKKLSLFAIFTLFVGMAFGQIWPTPGPSVRIHGLVTNTAGLPVPGVAIAAFDTSLRPFIFGSGLTNQIGQYNIYLTGRVGGGTFHLRFVDCLGNIYQSSVPYTSSGHYLRNFNVLCALSGPNPPPIRPCHANFVALPDTGLGVRVSPHMRDNTLSYSWNFGDGNTSNTMLASHQYQSAGSYTITLIVSRTQPTCSDTETSVVNIPFVPVVNRCFSRFDYRNDTTLTLRLRARNTDTTSTYNWSFGDGSTGNGRNVSHTYLTRGVYFVRLVVSNSLTNCSDTSISRVLVPRPRRGPFPTPGPNPVSGGGNNSTPRIENGGHLDKITTLEVYPNPVNDLLNVVFNVSESGEALLNIHDLAGRVVIKQILTLQKGQNKFEINTFGISRGSYFITLTTPNEKGWLNLVKD